MTITAALLADGSALPGWPAYHFNVTDTVDEAYYEDTGGIRFIVEYDYGFTGAAPAVSKDRSTSSSPRPTALALR